MAEQNPNLQRCPDKWAPAFEFLIDEWLDPMLPGTAKPRQLSHISDNDMDKLGIKKPADRAVARSVRIDRQGSFARNGKTYVNVQGQYSNVSVFHVNVLADYKFGKDRIKEAMMGSLKTVTSQVLDA